jgi:acylphosphatase
MIGRRVFYEGRVQGVGFRWTVKDIARGFDVTGWVKNLSDGRVELLVHGEAAELEAFLHEIEDSHLKGHIKNVTAQPETYDAKVRGFEIAR